MTDDHTDLIPYASPWTPDGINAVDFLRTIFSGQEILMARYHGIEKTNFGHVVEIADLGDLDSRLVQARIHELFGFLVRELGEGMQELKISKPWKQTFVASDPDKFREEMADSLHFFVEICITAGISADELFAEYFKAWSKNRGRQDSGY